MYNLIPQSLRVQVMTFLKTMILTTLVDKREIAATERLYIRLSTNTILI
jgi:hypothetical protein